MDDTKAIYVPMKVNPWRSLLVDGGVPASSGPGAGFLVAYDSMEALREDYPDAQVMTFDVLKKGGE